MKVLGLGDAGVDLVMRVDRLPLFDEKVMAKRVERLPGGMIANFVCSLAALGTPSAFLGCVGADDFGNLCRHAMVSRDVDVSRLIVKPGEDTYCCVNLLAPTGEKALIIGATGAIFPEPSDIGSDQFQDITLLHTTGLRAATALKAMSLAKAQGAQISLDLEPSAIQQGPEVVAELLAATDVLFVNRHAVDALAPKPLPIEGSGEWFLKKGPRLVVMTLGDEGACALSERETASCSAFAVHAVDTTGAGDCFSAAFIHGYLRGWPLLQTTRFASAAAALSTTGLGGQSALPFERDVLAFLESAAPLVPRGAAP